YPPDPDNLLSFISRIDAALMADGAFSEIIYNSTINYLTRRLITTARYFKRKSERDGLSERDFIYNLRKFLKYQIRIPGDKIELIHALLSASVKVSSRGPTPKTLRRIKRKGGTCHLCRGPLNMNEPEKYDSATVDHTWPNSMGGSNEDQNLRLSCLRC